MSSYLAFSADGHEARWVGWDAASDGLSASDETTTIAWENEGWTVSGSVAYQHPTRLDQRESLQYVLRIAPTWQVRQFLLFRDMEDPDLWLGTDGSGRWGEMNGAHRPELDGCYDIDLACTPFTNTLPIRRLPLLVGHSAELPVVYVDAETLDVRADLQRYTRLTEHRWLFEQIDSGFAAEFEVDQHGLVIDYPGLFRRAT